MEETSLFEGEGTLDIIIDEANILLNSENVSAEPCWLSWVVFQHPYKSPQFSLKSSDQRILFKSNDTISFKYYFRPMENFSLLPKEVLSLFPLKFFLCNADGVFAVSLFNPFEGLSNDDNGFKFPLKSDLWIYFQQRSHALEVEENSVPILKVRVRLTISTNYRQEKLSPFMIPVKKEDSEAAILPDNLIADHDERLRHYQIHINLHSLKGMQRPSYLCLNFSYPHFGTNSVVRTPAQYFQAMGETKINKGVVTYDFISTERSLTTILHKFPLNIDCMQRTHLGTEVIGTWKVQALPIGSRLEDFLHSFRCPRSNKVFQSREEYDLYSKHVAKFGEHIPPDIVYAIDQSVHLGANESELTSTLRIILIVEDKGDVGKELPLKVQSGYSRHFGGVFSQHNASGELFADSFQGNLSFEVNKNLPEIEDPADLSLNDRLLLDWEMFRQKSEHEWREALAEKEKVMRLEIEREMNNKFANIFDDVKRSQQEVSKLEARLKASLELVDKERMQLALLRDSCNTQLKQRLAELSIYSRKCKLEAKTVAEQERQEKSLVEKNLLFTQQQSQLLERRFQQLQQSYEELQERYNTSNEMKLREELLTSNSKIQQLKESLEIEKRKVVDVTYEKENLRSQMYKLASCLKRERERNAIVAKQELEQLRLEFLAREERFILDGDRRVLNSIKTDLINLKRAEEELETPNRNDNI